MSEYFDFPTHRPSADVGNDELVCFHCKTPVKEINNRLEGHRADCKYRLAKQGK